MTVETNLQDNLDNQTAPFLQEAESTFQWTKQWYPVAVAEFLDSSRPHAIQLLGKDLVLWQDNSGQWHCFEDFCPHRLAPLSEGRIESDGTLLCAYHAWRFDRLGNCVNIPQSKDKETEARNCANQKSRAVVYPTQKLQDLIWVWAESGTEAEVESQLRQPRTVSELDDPSSRIVKPFWNIRDLPYGWDFFMENVADPAHVPVSHHGIMGSRYEDTKYYDMPRLREMSTQEGFAFEVTPTASNIKQTIHDFQPPCHMRIVTSFEDGGQLILVLYAIPTRPGWCRHIGRQILIKSDAGKTPPGLGFFALPMPKWLNHILASLFLHQDLIFLHYQEKIIAKRGKNKWLGEVYTPNPQDKAVIAFRQWLAKRAGGGVPWDAGCNLQLLNKETDSEKLFDVWTTHTKDCQVCQDALKNINRLTVLSYAGAIACLFLALFLDGRYVAMQALTEPASISMWNTLPPLGFGVAIAGAIILAITGYLLKKLSQLFYVYKFSHADNN
ncbi:aromatic ring-hydroxylating dioxygenase subunit alpha [Pleurocapsa sp. FMAR1]|uniref:aromatic ring-hydroxylating dioxygenase subunit alpha n=1 Tax=Pleurocapsa sp. FMAR1 TaxID=3040204 RepID=UPI0029C7B3CF|nr:Rieske 2Fe-2S domain-containing protein [Pleurocapsa sp. FMAR1]